MNDLNFVPVDGDEVEIFENANDVVVNKKVEKNTNTNSGININLCNHQIVDNPIKFVIN